MSGKHKARPVLLERRVPSVVLPSPLQRLLLYYIMLALWVYIMYYIIYILSIYIYIYTYVCICIYVSTHLCMYIYIYIHFCIYGFCCMSKSAKYHMLSVVFITKLHTVLTEAASAGTLAFAVMTGPDGIDVLWEMY